MIKVQNLKKNFGKLEVLKDISVDIEEGEVVVLIYCLEAASLHSCAVLTSWRKRLREALW